ncbi:MAG: virulence RhuM family protein [Firmicutes bacterium]|nr:virulence RhuM family protein [Bacillota bacterium]
MYLDIAENRAKRQMLMKMKDWVDELDLMLKNNKYEVLADKGSISNEQAKDFAENEFDKYKVLQDKKYISDFDKVIAEITKKKK